MIKKLLNSLDTDEGSYFNLNNIDDFIKNENKITVVTLIGSQSSGKSTTGRSMFNVDFKTGQFKTTDGCDICVKDEYVILNAEGYMSLDNEIGFLRMMAKESNKFQMAREANKKKSLKIGIFLWAISDIIIYCLKSSELQSPSLFEMLKDLQEMKYNKDVNDPYIYFICVNEWTEYNNDNNDILIERLKMLLESYNILGKYSIKILPLIHKNNGKELHQNIMKNILNEINEIKKLDIVRLTENTLFWKTSIPNIFYDIQNNENLMSIEQRQKKWCIDQYEKCYRYYKDSLPNDNFKLVNHDELIENCERLYNEKAFGKYREQYIEQLREEIGVDYVIYHKMLKLKINRLYENLKLQIIDKYCMNYKPINYEEHVMKVKECRELYLKFSEDVSIELLDKNDWEYEINEIYLENYVGCEEKCASGNHVCNVRGNHRNHKFNEEKYRIVCDKNCGYFEEYDCDEKNIKFVCGNKKIVNCINNCGETKNVECDEFKSFNCGRNEKQVCSGCKKFTGKINSCHELGHYGWCEGYVRSNCKYCHISINLRCDRLDKNYHDYNCLATYPSSCVLCTRTGNDYANNYWMKIKEIEERLIKFRNIANPRWAHPGSLCKRSTDSSNNHYDCCGQPYNGTGGCAYVNRI